MNPAYIVDTNVVVAGLTASQAGSPVARTLDAMVRAAFPFVLSPALLAEYRTVLLRPKLVKLHGLGAAQIDDVLTELAQSAIVLSPPEQASMLDAPDPGDQFLWNLLAFRSELILVTGDKRLQQDALMGHRVITPQVLVARFQH